MSVHVHLHRRGRTRDVGERFERRTGLVTMVETDPDGSRWIVVRDPETGKVVGQAQMRGTPALSVVGGREKW